MRSGGIRVPKIEILIGRACRCHRRYPCRGLTPSTVVSLRVRIRLGWRPWLVHVIRGCQVPSVLWVDQGRWHCHRIRVESRSSCTPRIERRYERKNCERRERGLRPGMRYSLLPLQPPPPFSGLFGLEIRHARFVDGIEAAGPRNRICKCVVTLALLKGGSRLKTRFH